MSYIDTAIWLRLLPLVMVVVVLQPLRWLTRRVLGRPPHHPLLIDDCVHFPACFLQPVANLLIVCMFAVFLRFAVFRPFQLLGSAINNVHEDCPDEQLIIGTQSADLGERMAEVIATRVEKLVGMLCNKVSFKSLVMYM